MSVPAPVLSPVGTEYELQAGWRDVPAGFRTNGASIPRLLWPLLGSPFDPRFIAAAVEHDHAYRFGVPGREEADFMFRAALTRAGVRWPWSLALWLGVRLFGWLYWRRCRYGRGLAG